MQRHPHGRSLGDGVPRHQRDTQHYRRLLIRHQMRSQEAEELMHFMEGKYQIDAYALTPEDQKPIEEVFDFLLKPWASEPTRALGGSA